jgi:polyphosphate kinase
MRAFHRDLSWLEFNRRVLAQAADSRTPLLERVRFIAIFTSNLDEFFMKRVGMIKQQASSGQDWPSPDGMTPRAQLAAVRNTTTQLVQEQHAIFREQLIPQLAKEGIAIVRWDQLSQSERAFANEWYQQHVFSALTPLAVNPTHKFPFISNLSDNIGLLVMPPPGGVMPGRHRGAPSGAGAGASGALSDPLATAMKGGKSLRKQPRPQTSLLAAGDEGPEPTFCRLKIPSTLGKFVQLPSVDGRSFRLVPVRDVIRANVHELFPGMQIRDQATFRVTRSAGVQRDDIETANLLQSIEADLKQRKFAKAVRLEVEADIEPAFQRWLVDKLNVDQLDVYRLPTDFDLAGVAELCDLPRADLRHKPWKPVLPPRLAAASVTNTDRTPANFFAQIRKQDILVHHPYESFNASVERFIAAAANDPEVLTIKQTLYRTTPDSPFIENLMRAAESGKQVACLVELRARFDEDRNVRFARQLEKAGVHVAYGVLGLKTHCKTSLVVRREKTGLRCYAHLGTGNYHPKTAQLYTDVGLLTADPEITSDLVHLFNYLTGLAAAPTCDTLLVAPFSLRDRVLALIEREIAFAKAGKPARIMAKLNAMEDRLVTKALYAASQAGVQIDLVVRGFCCLVPGVKGLSENIRVTSVIGRFLEHSRLYFFGAGELDAVDGDWYISSADWMYRNLSNRVEVACPVRDRAAKARLARIMQVHAEDGVNAWDLASDGTYTRRTPSVGKSDAGVVPAAHGTFETLMHEAMQM